MIDEEHSEPAGIEEGKDEELHRDEPETLGTTQTIEVSTIVPPIDSASLINQSKPSHQSPQSSITSSAAYTHTGNLGSSMADEMRLHIFRGDGFEDPDQH